MKINSYLSVVTDPTKHLIYLLLKNVVKFIHEIRHSHPDIIMLRNHE